MPSKSCPACSEDALHDLDGIFRTQHSCPFSHTIMVAGWWTMIVWPKRQWICQHAWHGKSISCMTSKHICTKMGTFSYLRRGVKAHVHKVSLGAKTVLTNTSTCCGPSLPAGVLKRSTLYVGTLTPRGIGMRTQDLCAERFCGPISFPSDAIMNERTTHKMIGQALNHVKWMAHACRQL